MASLTLYIDNSVESQKVREALEKTGKQFKVVFASGFRLNVPAIQTSRGTVEGYSNICRYLLPISQ